MAVFQSQYPTSLDTLDTLGRASNAALTSLSASISTSDTAITVSSTAAFPPSGNFVIEDEIITFAAKTSNTFTGCIRGTEGTTATSHPLGVDVSGEITAAHTNNQNGAILALETKVGVGATTLPDQLSALDARLDVLEATPSLPALTHKVSEYGASGSSVTTTGTIGAGSTSLTVASAASFAVGQGIRIDNAGSASDTTGTFHVSKITAISGTTLTLETAAVRAVSAAVVMHDDTRALQAALDAAIAAGGGTILFDAPALYRLNGPVNPATNSILSPPYVAVTAGTPVYAALQGARQVLVNYDGAAQTSGAILQTDRRGANASSSILACALYNDTFDTFSFSNLALEISGLTFRTYNDPGISALDLGLCYRVTLRDVLVDTGMPLTGGAVPTSSSFGLRLPRTMSWGAETSNVFVLYYPTGIIFSELWKPSNTWVMRCKTGVRNTIGLYLNCGYLLLWQCPTGIEIAARSHLRLTIDFEHEVAGQPWAPLSGRDLYDFGNQATGIIEYLCTRSMSAANEPISITGLSGASLVSLGGFDSVLVGNNLVRGLSVDIGGDDNPVSLAPADSAGTGYSALRVPNGAVVDHLTGLVSYWKLDEASGTRADSHGAFALVPTGTVGSTAGKLSNAANFTGAGVLSVPTAAALQTGDLDFAVALWVRLASKAADQQFVGKTSTGSDEYAVGYDQVNDRFRFLIKDATLTYQILRADNAGSPALSTWYFIAAWHDAALDTLNISVNAGLPNTLSVTNGSPIAGPEPFIIGGYSSTTSLATALIDEVQFRKNYIFTTDDLTYYYGGGTPPAYPFT
jgi:hypothetical protein